MTLLPDMKTVRLMGTKKNKAVVITDEQGHINQTVAVKHTKAEKNMDLRKKYTIEIEALKLQREDALTARKNFTKDQLIRYNKKLWGCATSEESGREHYLAVQKAKKERDLLMEKVYDINIKISDINQKRSSVFQQYIPTTRRTLQPHEFLCLLDAGKVLLKPEIINNEIRFSGTDNGVISMTETTSFDIEKFDFHVKLFYLYSTLQADGEVYFEEEEKKMISVPKPFAVKSETVKNSSGGYTRDRLLREKKSGSEEGKQVS